jgi:Domain of unknown function (DUF1127)
MWKHLRDWWRAWGDLVHLDRLDDRLLADMGIEREAIQNRVMGRTGAVAHEAGEAASQPMPDQVLCDCR